MSGRTSGPWAVTRGIGSRPEAVFAVHGRGIYLFNIEAATLEDAMLAAAAPELLAELIDMVAVAERGGYPASLKGPRAAIAKARGES